MVWPRKMWRRFFIHRKERSKLDVVLADYVNPVAECKAGKISSNEKAEIKQLKEEVTYLNSLNSKLLNELNAIKELNLAKEKEIISLKIKLLETENTNDQNTKSEEFAKTDQPQTTKEIPKWNLTEKDLDNLRKFRQIFYPIILAQIKKNETL